MVKKFKNTVSKVAFDLKLRSRDGQRIRIILPGEKRPIGDRIIMYFNKKKDIKAIRKRIKRAKTGGTIINTKYITRA
jgi:hypothetical protein